MRTLAVWLTAVAAVAATAACSRAPTARREQPLPPDQAEQLLTERIWLDQLPRTQHQRFHVAVFDPGGHAITQDRTVWKGQFEVFQFDVEGNRLELVFPASSRTVRRTFKVVRPSGKAPADVKLIIDDNPLGPREYWGFDPEGQHDDVEGWIARHVTAP